MIKVLDGRNDASGWGSFEKQAVEQELSLAYARKHGCMAIDEVFYTCNYLKTGAGRGGFMVCSRG